jgi:hypothetical protein
MHPSLTTAVAAAQRQELLASAAATRRARQARRARRARRADVGRNGVLGTRPVSMPWPGAANAAAAAASPAGCQPSAALRPANWR